MGWFEQEEEVRFFDLTDEEVDQIERDFKEKEECQLIFSKEYESLIFTNF